MRHLTLGEVVELHRRLLLTSGGAPGIRDIRLLESALAQPAATFDGADLHPTLVDKAAALGFSLVANHAFVEEASVVFPSNVPESAAPAAEAGSPKPTSIRVAEVRSSESRRTFRR